MESRSIVRALNAAGARASFVEIDSDKCHDAFLLEWDALAQLLTRALSLPSPGRDA